MIITLQEFADIIGQELEIIYYPNQKGRWCAQFNRGEIKDGRILISAFENGETPDIALRNYAKRIQGCQIVFNAMDKERRKEFFIPENLIHGEIK